MADPFQNFARAPADPASRCVAVTPSDATALSDIPKALYVGSAGTITMAGADDVADAVWKGVAAGAILPFRAKFVRATGTTAADILALY